jgi:hypothetical protein
VSIKLLGSHAGRVTRSWLQAAVLMVGGLGASVCLAQTVIGPGFWDCQTNMTEGGPGNTQLQALANWLSRFGETLSQISGPCGKLGTPQYRGCTLDPRDGADVPLICPNGGGASPDGLTCPGSYYVSTEPVPLADCGCDKNNNNKLADPLSPSNGNVSYHEDRVHKVHLSASTTAMILGSQTWSLGGDIALAVKLLRTFRRRRMCPTFRRTQEIQRYFPIQGLHATPVGVMSVLPARNGPTLPQITPMGCVR